MINSNMNNASPETVDDRELEELLAGALDAPSVPRSLLKRLDQGIEKEWGDSPRLADSRVDRLQRRFARSSRWVRGLPIAAVVAAAVVCVALMNSSGTAYAWSSMLNALSQSGIIEYQQNGVTLAVHRLIDPSFPIG